jgi:hypothetical protein
MARRAVALVRTAALVRGGWGVALLAAPAVIMAALGHPGAGAGRPVARLLGARQLAQAVVTAAVPSPGVVTGGAVVDALHGLTGAGLAVVAPGWRRVALTDAAVAAVLAGLGGYLGRRDADRRPDGPEGRTP